MFAAVFSAIVLAQTAFVDLPQLISGDPLYPVLQQYDREISALRETQRTQGLTNVAGAAANNAARMRAAVSAAHDRVASIATAHGGEFDRREALVLQTLQSPQSIARDSTAFANESMRTATATLQAYRQALETRTERALEARSQELSEKESTLAFDLEKRDAGKRLPLELKLHDLRISKVGRATLQAQLDALDARVVSQVRRLRNADATILADYRSELLAAQTRDDAQMTAQIRANGIAYNSGRTSSSVTRSSLPLASGYRFESDASAIEDGFRQASADLSARFDELAAADRSSQGDTNARIAALRIARESLFRAIVVRALQRELASVNRARF